MPTCFLRGGLPGQVSACCPERGRSSRDACAASRHSAGNICGARLWILGAAAGRRRAVVGYAWGQDPFCPTLMLGSCPPRQLGRRVARLL